MGLLFKHHSVYCLSFTLPALSQNVLNKALFVCILEGLLELNNDRVNLLVIFCIFMHE